MSRHVSRTALLILLGCLACAAEGAAVDDRYAADPKLRRFVDSMHDEPGQPQSGQIVGAAYIDGVVIYGTRVPATGSLLWFSPEAKAPPAPVANQRAGRGEIQVGGVTLSLERGADLWTVTWR